jgi:hypothetical protein
MFLTSSGFTTVVKYCSMTKSSVCCCGSENACKSEVPVGTSTIESPDSKCFSEKIVGGLNDIDAVMSQEVSGKAIVLVVEAEAPVFQSSIVALQSPSFILPESSVDDSPGVEIYVRVNSFLI